MLIDLVGGKAEKKLQNVEALVEAVPALGIVCKLIETENGRCLTSSLNPFSLVVVVLPQRILFSFLMGLHKFCVCVFFMF